VRVISKANVERRFLTEIKKSLERNGGWGGKVTEQ